MLVQHDHTLTFASTRLLTSLPDLTEQNMDIIFTCQVHPFVASGLGGGGGGASLSMQLNGWVGPGHIYCMWRATCVFVFTGRGGEEVLSDLCTPTYSHVCTITHMKWNGMEWNQIKWNNIRSNVWKMQYEKETQMKQFICLPCVCHVCMQLWSLCSHWIGLDTSNTSEQKQTSWLGIEFARPYHIIIYVYNSLAFVHMHTLLN